MSCARCGVPLVRVLTVMHDALLIIDSLIKPPLWRACQTVETRHVYDSNEHPGRYIAGSGGPSSKLYHILLDAPRPLYKRRVYNQTRHQICQTAVICRTRPQKGGANE